MIIICKHGREVKAQLDWDGWMENLETYYPGSHNRAASELLKLKPAGISKDEFRKFQFIRLEGCPYCKWIEVDSN